MPQTKRVFDESDFADTPKRVFDESDFAPNESETLMASRRAASKAEFEKNLPQSTAGTRLREAAIGALEPFTLKNMWESAKGLGYAGAQALRGNMQPLVPLATAMVKAPIEPLKELVSGYQTGDYDKMAHGAGGFLTQTVPAIEGAANLGRTVGRPVIQGAAERMYESALKPGPRSNTVSDIHRMVRTGLEEGIPVSYRGLQKLGNLQNELNAQVANQITDQAPPISKFDVARRLNDPAATFAAQVNPEADLAALSDVGNEFLRTQPNEILPTTAQRLKVGTYRQLKDRAYGELKGAQVEGQKALARGLKEELEARFPNAQAINQRLGETYNLEPELEAAVNRSANHNILGLTTPMVGAAVDLGTGSMPAAVASGLMHEVLGRPAIKSRIAIGLDRLVNPARTTTLAPQPAFPAPASAAAAASAPVPVPATAAAPTPVRQPAALLPAARIGIPLPAIPDASFVTGTPAKYGSPVMSTAKGRAIGKALPTLTRSDAQTIAARLEQFRDLVRSGATEMTGKAIREEGTGAIVGRHGGGMKIMFPEFAQFPESPAQIAAAIANRRGPLYERIVRAATDALPDERPSDLSFGPADNPTRTRLLDAIRQMNISR